MDWQLVEEEYLRRNNNSKKLDVLIIILSFIGLILLAGIYIYNIHVSKSYKNYITVASNKIIDEKYELTAEYYLIHKDYKIVSDRFKFFMNYLFIEDDDIVIGRNVESDFEVVLSKKYEYLFDEKIPVKINDKFYVFKVVGIFDDFALTDNYVGVNFSTLELFNNSDDGVYFYMFIVNKYKQINDSLDILELANYDVVVKLNDNSMRLSNYTSFLDALVFASIMLELIIIILIIQFII